MWWLQRLLQMVCHIAGVAAGVAAGASVVVEEEEVGVRALVAVVVGVVAAFVGVVGSCRSTGM